MFSPVSGKHRYKVTFRLIIDYFTMKSFTSALGCIPGSPVHYETAVMYVLLNMIRQLIYLSASYMTLPVTSVYSILI